jgi:aromatic ring hydroxylase
MKREHEIGILAAPQIEQRRQETGAENDTRIEWRSMRAETHAEEQKEDIVGTAAFVDCRFERHRVAIQQHHVDQKLKTQSTPKEEARE